MSRSWCFLLLLGFVKLAHGIVLTDVENCGGEFISAEVEPCSKEPCEIPRGESVNIRAHCKSNAHANKLRLTVWADLQGVELPYPGMKRDACKNKNITCPVTHGQHIHLLQRFEVKSFFPKVETRAKFILKTNDAQDITVCCFKAPVKVVDSLPREHIIF